MAFCLVQSTIQEFILKMQKGKKLQVLQVQNYMKIAKNLSRISRYDNVTNDGRAFRV